MRKLLSILLCLVLCTSALLLTACGGSEETPDVGDVGAEDNEAIRAIYAAYVAYAEKNGHTPEDYDAWLESIRGEAGANGADGLTPYIGENGNWWIGNTDTKVKAESKGIVSIEKISENGKTDNYRITYTDGSTAVFKITNGADGKDGVGIADVKFNNLDELVVVLTSGNEINLGKLVGEDGKDGADGEDGKDGKDGTDGVSITSAEINEAGELVLGFSNGTNINLGSVVGPKGEQGEAGADGSDGKDGVGIASIIIDDYGCLIISLTDGSVKNLGKVTGSDGEDFSACEHNFGEWLVVYEPTCDCIGVNYRVCSICKEVEHDYIKKTGHSLIFVETIKNTCSEHKVLKYCTICGAAYILDLETETDHNFGSWYTTVEKTCTSNGESRRDCVNCEYYETRILQSEHTLAIAPAVEATCETTGLTEGKYCSICREVFVEQAVVPALGHTIVIDEAVEASCTKTGLTEGKHCFDCGITIIAQEIIDYLDHDYANGICVECGESESGATPNEYFTFTLLDDDTYSIRVKDRQNLPNKVIIPSSYNGKAVTQIGMQAFSYCQSLTDITIPDSITSISDSAFSNCVGLSSIIIPNSVTTVGNYTFNNCSNITSVSIGCNVVSIGDSAFYKCSGITEIIIPDSIVSIGSSAFDGCTGISSIWFGGGVTNIGLGAFRILDTYYDVYVTDLEAWLNIDCDGYARPNYYGMLHILDKNGYEKTNIVIPEGAARIPECAFRNADSITEITISKSVASIGWGAFPQKVKDVYISDVEAWINIECAHGYDRPNYYGSLHILDKYGNEITDLIIPDGVSSISRHAFYNAKSITSVKIPDSVTAIEGSAFAYCSKLESVYLSQNVSYIELEAFFYCENLAAITIPSSVTYISAQAFYNCSSLPSIVIPDSVTSIGGGAFGGCDKLTIYCEAESQPEGWNSNWNSSNRPVVWGYTSED